MSGEFASVRSAMLPDDWRSTLCLRALCGKFTSVPSALSPCAFECQQLCVSVPSVANSPLCPPPCLRARLSANTPPCASVANSPLCLPPCLRARLSANNSVSLCLCGKFTSVPSALSPCAFECQHSVSLCLCGKFTALVFSSVATCVLHHLCDRSRNSLERRLPLLPRHQRKCPEDVFELGARQLIQRRGQRVQPGEATGRCRATADRAKAAISRNAAGACSGVGTGSRSTTAVVTCVVTRNRTR